MDRSLDWMKSCGKTSREFLHYPANAINFESRKLSAFRITAQVFFLILLLSKTDSANCGSTTVVVDAGTLQTQLVNNSSSTFSSCTVTADEISSTQCKVKAICTCDDPTKKFTKEHIFNNGDVTTNFSTLDSSFECTYEDCLDSGDITTLVDTTALANSLHINGGTQFTSCNVTNKKIINSSDEKKCRVTATCKCSNLDLAVLTHVEEFAEGKTIKAFLAIPTNETSCAMPANCWKINTEATNTQMTGNGFSGCRVNSEIVTEGSDKKCKVTAICDCPRLYELNYTETFPANTTETTFTTPPTTDKCTMTTALIAIIIVSSLAGIIIMIGLGYYFIKKYRQN